MSSATSILFFSNYCNHCKQVLHELNDSSLRTNIRFICIDSADVRKKLPAHVKSVPCLIVGQTNQTLIGSDILHWIKMKSKKQNIQISVPVQQNQQSSNTKGETGPGAWHMCEMNNFSDAYSFLNVDLSTKGNGGTSMSHSFEFLNGNPFDSSSSSLSMPAGAPSRSSMPVSYSNPTQEKSEYNSFGSIQNSETEDFMSRKMEEIMNQRELDVPNVPTRI